MRPGVLLTALIAMLTVHVRAISWLFRQHLWRRLIFVLVVRPFASLRAVALVSPRQQPASPGLVVLRHPLTVSAAQSS